MLSVHKTTVFFFKSTSKHEKQLRGTGTGRQFVLTARTKTIERTGTGRQFPPSLASLSATKFSLQIYMELTGENMAAMFVLAAMFVSDSRCTQWVHPVRHIVFDRVRDLGTST